MQVFCWQDLIFGSRFRWLFVCFDMASGFLLVGLVGGNAGALVFVPCWAIGCWFSGTRLDFVWWRLKCSMHLSVTQGMVRSRNLRGCTLVVVRDLGFICGVCCYLECVRSSFCRYWFLAGLQGAWNFAGEKNEWFRCCFCCGRWRQYSTRKTLRWRSFWMKKRSFKNAKHWTVALSICNNLSHLKASAIWSYCTVHHVLVSTPYQKFLLILIF